MLKFLGHLNLLKPVIRSSHVQVILFFVSVRNCMYLLAVPGVTLQNQHKAVILYVWNAMDFLEGTVLNPRVQVQRPMVGSLTGYCLGS